MNLKITFLILSAIFFAPLTSSIKQKPIIGVLTQPSPYDGYPSNIYSYIAGSYISHLEAAGARVIPIQWDTPFDKFIDILSQINGLYFPGGGVKLVENNTFTQYQEVANYLVDLVIQINKGTYFPLMGICLGFEMIALAVARDPSILIYFPHGENVKGSLYPSSTALNSTMFKYMNPYLFNAISQEQLAYFMHAFVPNPFAWKLNPYLAGNFTITTWTKNSAGKSYVASAEGKNLPIYGLQFHPEKNTYEWSKEEVVPHNADAVSLQQHMANFFVNQTRLNQNLLADTDYRKLSIYNYHAHHKLVDPEFEQIYFIKNYNATYQQISYIE